jgi:signal transduction histidine kinase
MSQPVPQRTASRVLGSIIFIVVAAALAASVVIAALENWTAPGRTLGAGSLALSFLALAVLFGVAAFAVAHAVRGEELRAIPGVPARELDALIEARTLELSALSTHLQELAEKEKSVLARNLHDQLGGLLTAAKMDASWLQGRIGSDGAVQQRLQQLGNVLDEAMDVKRRVVEELRPSLLDHFGLPVALRAYLETVSAKSGLACEAMIAEEADVPKDVAIGLFRVVQEALSNVVRHASARSVRLTLACEGTVYSLSVADDGKGFDLASPDFRWSHGLAGMRHRVRALGGQLALHSEPQCGTILKVHVPRDRPAAH